MAPRVEVSERQTDSILTENRASDVPYKWTLNPYRGCAFGCLFCWGRGTHEYLGLDPSRDFERVFWAKMNAAARLTEAFARPSWKGETVMFSPVTEPYQPLEVQYGLTRACLEVCLAHRNPVMLNTKSMLVLRDVELLKSLAREARLELDVSMAFADESLARHLEPGAPSPVERFQLIRKLSDAGLEVGVLVAPVIPGLNDDQVGEVLERAASAGAKSASWVYFRSPPPIGDVFSERLRAVLPERAEGVLRRSLGHAHGRAPTAEAMALYEEFLGLCEVHGLRVKEFQSRPEATTPFRRPHADQLKLL